MQDKYVRRRRAVLAVLVAVSLILLTAYFGEAENSPLHSIQQGIVEVFTPIQEGASKVLSPIRDLAGWVSSTLHAKSENKELVSANARLNAEIGQAGIALQENRNLLAMLHMTNRLDLSRDDPAYASVIGYNPQAYYESIKIDKGTGAGIAVSDPVLAQGGLVGLVTNVGSNYAVVSGLSSPEVQVEAKIEDPAGISVGTLTPAVGDPTTLVVNYLPSTATINSSDEVVTAGYYDTANKQGSLYPQGIPIGTVSNFNYNTLANNGTVNVSPYVTLRNVSDVEVLTKVSN